MANKGKIILYCDYGMDDAIATAHILSRASDYAKVYIVPISGNQPLKLTFENAFKILGEFEGGISNVVVVDTRSLAQPYTALPYIHGNDGVGDFLRAQDVPYQSDITSDNAENETVLWSRAVAPLACDSVVVKRYVVGGEAAVPVLTLDAFKAELENNPCDDDVVLSLGPCTVPKYVGYLPKRTVLMGGCVTETPNFGKYEFNEALDPIAFKDYSARAAAVAAMDVCHDKAFNIRSYSRRSGNLIDRLIARLNVIYEVRVQQDPCVHFVAYDLVAALYVTDPDMFGVETVFLSEERTYNNLFAKDKAKLKI